MLNTIPFHGTLLGRSLGDRGVSTHGHVLVYGAIEAHSFGEKGCIASNGKIADETGLSLSTVKTYLSEIAGAGWIEVVLDDKTKGRMMIIPLMALTAVKGGVDHSQRGRRLQSNIDNSIDNNENNADFFGDAEREKNSAKREKESQQDLLFLIIQQINPKEKVTDDRLRLLRGRLKDYSVMEIKQAAFLFSKSEWHKKNGQMSIDNLLAPSKFGRWHSQVSQVISTKSQDELLAEMQDKDRAW